MKAVDNNTTSIRGKDEFEYKRTRAGIYPKPSIDLFFCLHRDIKMLHEDGLVRKAGQTDVTITPHKTHLT